jgi:hypothetical protein
MSMRRTLACVLIAVAVCAGSAGCSVAATSPGRAATAPAAPRTSVTSGVTSVTSVASVTASTRLRWSALPASPLGARSDPLVAWAGGQLLEIGGLAKDGTQATSATAAFDPTTGRWHRIAPVPAAGGVNLKDPSGLSQYPATAWTGHYLAVANGRVTACRPADPTAVDSGTAAAACWTGVALYDPATNRWTALTLPKQLIGLEATAVTWTGRDIVVAAVDTADFDTDHGRLAVAEYAQATGRWQVITPAVSRSHPPRFVDLADAGGRLLLWSMWDRTAQTKDGFSDHAGVDVLALGAQGTWRNVTGSWPQGQTVSAPVATDDGLLFAPGQIWCGISCSPPYYSEPGYFANPATLARKTIPGGPLGQAGPVYVWAGDAIIAVNLGDQLTGPGINIRPGDLTLFDPATSRWTELPTVPGHPSLSVSPVWTGTELLTLTDAGRLLALHR